MIDATIFIIRSFAAALGSLLNVPIPLSDNSTIYVYDVFLFIFLAFMFIKFLGVVTHNQSITRKE